jgi:hypothetical protein
MDVSIASDHLFLASIIMVMDLSCKPLIFCSAIPFTTEGKSLFHFLRMLYEQILCKSTIVVMIVANFTPNLSAIDSKSFFNFRVPCEVFDCCNCTYVSLMQLPTNTVTYLHLLVVGMAFS